jgi:hypothetical protein
MAKPLDIEPKYESSEFMRAKSVFTMYAMGSQIWQTGYRNLPNAAVDRFEGVSARFMDPSQYVPQDFDALYRLQHPNGSESWAALQHRLVADHALESLVYIIDINSDNATETGHGEIRYCFNSTSRFFHQKPFEFCASTDEKHRRKGLGRQRLIVMNAISQMLYHLPLHSDTVHDLNTLNDVRGLWLSLVTQGLAAEISHTDYSRFVFKQDPTNFNLKTNS